MAFIFIVSLTSRVTSVKKSESLDDDYDESCFILFRQFIFLLRTLLLNFLYFMSSGKSDSLDYESENYGSDSRSSDTCALPRVFTNTLVVLMD